MKRIDQQKERQRTTCISTEAQDIASQRQLNKVLVNMAANPLRKDGRLLRDATQKKKPE